MNQLRDALELFELLKQNHLQISTAESCTGGMIASILTSIPGISAVFTEGIVCYSNESKIFRLGVKKETIDTFGAVSKEVVSEMISGLKSAAGIAVSGIAGPDGGTKEKPLGTVVIGVKAGEKSIVEVNFFSGSRDEIREKSAEKAILMMVGLIRN